MSPRRRDDDPELFRRSREGPSPSRGPPHQTLRWVLGRARKPRLGPGACVPHRVARTGPDGQRPSSQRVSTAVLTLCEPGDPAVCLGPSLDYRPYPPRRTWAVQGIEQCLDGRTRSLGDDLDPAVVQVRGPADQPEFEGPCPHPPSKSDTLYMPVHPCRQSDIGRSLYRVHRQFSFSSPAHRPHQRPFRGRGWQRGQLNDERFMNGSRRIGVPQRGQGSSCRPYTCRERSK